MSEQTPTPPISPKSKKHIFSKDFMNYMRGIIDLSKGVDEPQTITNISNKISMEGANAWMLMCSIVIASIGLSQNSQAVIIGAMLISPLMSPILGIGLSVGINDMETLRRSLIHFGIAIAIALLTSTIYFEISPFDAITDEIQSRTEPTFLDIFIAIFGGIAGIISTARKDVSTTLPGVAIATALMPPLCVTGYGIAHGNWEFASRSFYLFFLNTFFVALATYLIVRLLRFERKEYIDEKRERRGQIIVFLFSIAIMVPSFFIFRGVLQDLRTDLSLQKFVTTCLGENSIYFDSYTYDKNAVGNTTLYLKVYGDVIREENHEEYEACLFELGLKNWEIKVLSSSEVNIDDVALIEKNIEEINKMVTATRNYQKISENLRKDFIESTIDSVTFVSIKTELKALYPELREFTLTKAQSTDFSKDQYNMCLAVVAWDDLNIRQQAEREERVREFLKVRLNTDTLRVITLQPS